MQCGRPHQHRPPPRRSTTPVRRRVAQEDNGDGRLEKQAAGPPFGVLEDGPANEKLRRDARLTRQTGSPRHVCCWISSRGGVEQGCGHLDSRRRAAPFLINPRREPPVTPLPWRASTLSYMTEMAYESKKAQNAVAIPFCDAMSRTVRDGARGYP